MSGKLVLVTGGAGFVGSHLIRRLLRDGHRVISLDNYFAGSKGAHVAGAEYREGHTKDIETLVPETPDLIYHLGEYSRVEQSVLEPDVVHDLNTVGTAAVIEFWKKKKCKLVYAGSSTKFGDGGAARHTSPYAATKAANTELVKKTGDEEGLPYAITYFYNVFGPGEHGGIYGTVIEWFKHMYLSGAPIPVVKPGTQTRNFTHVSDIVDGLVVVGEKGQGDEYGLGNEKAHVMLDVARMFSDNIVMLPERKGNRMMSSLDASKSFALGWKPVRSLEAYVREFLRTHDRGRQLEKRILVFSTTFHPVTGPAEEALVELMRAMPDVHFDVVTSAYSRLRKNTSPVPNAAVYSVGFGYPFDKYLLPFLGLRRARSLVAQHSYLFAWSLMASYAAFAGSLLKRMYGMPLLITLADQSLDNVPLFKRMVLRLILRNADQVYGMPVQESRARALVPGKALRQSLGAGDAFANQLRYAYVDILVRQRSV